MNAVYKDLIYLAYCSLNGVIPDKERNENINLEQLYAASKSLTMVSLIAFALESAGIHDNRFYKAKEKAMRKNLFLDTERRKLFAFCEDKGIWYMALKGSILKDLYPEYGMRQMSDNDILFDVTYRKDIKKYFESLGYEIVSYGKKIHDVYKKPPVLNFEMHNELFGYLHNPVWVDYYSNVKDRLIKDSDNKYGYHFSDDDFYIYITTHEYKHYSNRGTGLRSLVDRYVFIKNKELNWNYIESECNKLGIAEYENESRQLSLKLFENNPDSVEFTDAELKMLSYYLNSGTYGTLENRVNKAVDEKNGNKAKYLLSRIFPPKSFYGIYFPPSKKYPVLIPFLWIHRMMKGIFTKSKSIKAELKHLKKMDK